MAKVPGLFSPGYSNAYARSERRRSSVGILVYLAGTGVALLAPGAAVVLFLACAMFYATTARGSTPK